jgi:hypothetical protein
MITITIKSVAGGFVALVNTTKGTIEGKACTSPKFAIKSLRAVTKAMGRELPKDGLNIIGPAIKSEGPAIEFIEPTTTPAIESEEEAPDTEREPELHRALRPVEGRISPVDQPERWVAIYNGVKARYGTADAELVLTAMKGMNCASPFERDSEGRPFHMYADNSQVRAPRPGEGERRQLRNPNGYNRDFQGRTPVEPGSLARETDPFHPANKPERTRRMSRADRMAQGKAANAELRASDPAGFEAKQLASRLASQASKAQGGDTVAYKTAFVAVCTYLGAGRLDKCAKFASDLGLSEVPAAWMDWAAKSVAAAKAA